MIDDVNDMLLQEAPVAVQGMEPSYATAELGKHGIEIKTAFINGEPHAVFSDLVDQLAELYYDGEIESQEQYDTVLDAAERYMLLCDYILKVEMKPPVVTWKDRGTYYKKVGENTEGLADWLETMCQPVGITKEILKTKVAERVFGDDKMLTSDTVPQLDAIMFDIGWDSEVISEYTFGQYACGIEPNTEAAYDRLIAELKEKDGLYMEIHLAQRMAAKAAYGIHAIWDGPSMRDVITPIIAKAAEDEDYTVTTYYLNAIPRPVPEGFRNMISQAIAEAARFKLKDGRYAIEMVEVFNLLEKISGIRFRKYDIDRLQEKDSRMSTPLITAGFSAGAEWKSNANLDKESQREGELGNYRYYYVQEILIATEDKDFRVSLSSGHGIRSDVVIIDPDSQEIIALQMLGSRINVRANWAALMGNGKRRYWIGKQRVTITGMKSHIKISVALKAGWDETWLIHRQACAGHIEAGSVFYVINEEKEALVPKSFWQFLNYSISIPILPEWTEFLWVNGRVANLIQLMAGHDRAQPYGMIGWKVLPSEESWGEIITRGLVGGEIHFKAESEPEPEPEIINTEEDVVDEYEITVDLTED